MTPWAPIAIALIAMIGSALLVLRWTGNAALGISSGLLVLALALLGLAQIATIAYVLAGFVMLLAAVGFVAAWLGRGGVSR